MPDIEGVPYEATGGKLDQATAQALAARHREAATAGVTAAGAAGASAQAAAKTYTDQKVTGLATTVAMKAADALTLSNAKTYTDQQLADFDSFVGVPIFETLAEAEAWEAAHPGKRALTLESQTGPYAPRPPVFDDAANTITLPSDPLVQYRVDGVDASGVVNVGNVDRQVAVTAHGLDSERPLTGTTQWVGVFTRAAVLDTLWASTFDGDADPLDVFPADSPSGASLLATPNSTNPEYRLVKSGGSLVMKGGANATIGASLSLVDSVDNPGIRSVVYDIDFDFTAMDNASIVVTPGTHFNNTLYYNASIAVRPGQGIVNASTTRFLMDETTFDPATKGKLTATFNAAGSITVAINGTTAATGAYAPGYSLHTTQQGAMQVRGAGARIDAATVKVGS